MNPWDEYEFPPREQTDMYLPNKLLSFAIGSCVFSIAAVLASCTVLREAWLPLLLVGVFVFLPIGIGAFLCWKNQMLVMTSDEVFYYRTFLGKVYRLQFSQVQRVKKNMDSVQLILPEKAVQIESMAVVSEKFRARVAKIEETLQKERNNRK